MILHLNVCFLTIYWLVQMRTSDALYWENCNEDDIVKVTTLSITPNVIVLPGMAIIEGTAQVNRPLKGLTAEVNFSKKTTLWLRISCPKINCVIDFCELMDKEPSCTLGPGAITLSKNTYDYPVHMPGGNYSARLTLKSNGDQVGCLRFFFKVKSP